MKVKHAHWPAPKNISAITTTKASGFSLAPYTSNNLALHVEDNAEHVLKNRQQLVHALKLPSEPVWLNQTHSTTCIIAEDNNSRDADAVITRSPHYPLAILTADCLPITLCSSDGTEIAAIHAGWRGLFHGIVENTLAKMHNSPSNIMAWIGPAICQNCYEVGEDVYSAFTVKYPESHAAFAPCKTKWRADLPGIAEIVLNAMGVDKVYKSHLCTYESKDDFYSYRREAQTGRIATLIWFNE